jgi:hypothetical protein
MNGKATTTLFALLGMAIGPLLAAPETETWYDSKGKAIQLPKSPPAETAFVPQWKLREADRSSGPHRRYRPNSGDWWSGWSDAGYVGYGYGYRYYGGYVRPTYHTPARSHTAVWYRNGNWGVSFQRPGFSVRWSR